MLIKKSFTLAGHRTSVALEEEFWRALAAVGARDNMTLGALVAHVDGARSAPLASALRVLALMRAREGLLF